jgi:hypothetical protein
VSHNSGMQHWGSILSLEYFEGSITISNNILAGYKIYYNEGCAHGSYI